MNTRNLELWLRLASVPVECAGCGQYGWVQMDCLPQWLLTSLVVLGRYGLCSYLGTPPGVTVCDP